MAKPTAADVVLTAPEVAHVVSVLEPRSPITDHQVRYLAALHCVKPSGHAPTTCGDSALYTASDVALIRLILRLVAEGAPYWMARAAVAQCSGELRAVLSRARDVLFVVHGPVGAVLDQLEAPSYGWSVRVRETRRGLLAAIQAERRCRPLWARWGARTATEAAELIEVTA